MVDEYEKIAYAMQKAYRQTKTQGEAVERVKDEFPNANVEILWHMWQAIDAYVDINETS